MGSDSQEKARLMNVSRPASRKDEEKEHDLINHITDSLVIAFAIAIVIKVIHWIYTMYYPESHE